MANLDEYQFTSSPSGGYAIGGNISLNTSGIPSVTTRAVETKAGWRGQIRVNGRIVWESRPTAKDYRYIKGKSHKVSVGRRPRTEQEALLVARERVQRKTVEMYA